MKLKMMLLLACLSCGSMTFAGTGEGGGHSLEAAFKDKLDIIMENILLMSDAAKSKLNFNYQSLNAILKLEVLVLCADNVQIEKLQKLNKLAYVFKENSREIRINCSEDAKTVANWQKRLSSTDYVDDIFFLHEGLRAQNILDDDNYEYSSSYTQAYKQNVVDEDDRIFRLLHTRNNDCSIRYSSFGGKVYADLSIKGKKVNSFQIDENVEQYLAERKFINGDGQIALKARRNLLYLAQEKGCFR
ncbi:MAG: hypothetical protein AB7I27_19685 [Bacteriovoracaceae bacterium]